MITKSLSTPKRIAVAAAAVVLTGGLAANYSGAAPTASSSTSFPLFPNGAFVSCMAWSGKTPVANATVKRGKLNDTLTLKLSGFKPHLAFDLFTVEKSPQAADGSAAPGFTNFGFSWYQSDIETDGGGNANVKIQTILLDQIFGFDASRGVTPVNTFHVGFWFNNPADAAPCGFSGTTPFNGDHTAGPLAMVSRPSASTNLGPLCTSPVLSGGVWSCKP